jgi:hypothetical protein
MSYHEPVSKSFYCMDCLSEFTVVHPGDLNDEVHWCPFCSSEALGNEAGYSTDLIGDTK